VHRGMPNFCGECGAKQTATDLRCAQCGASAGPHPSAPSFSAASAVRARLYDLSGVPREYWLALCLSRVVYPFSSRCVCACVCLCACLCVCARAHARMWLCVCVCACACVCAWCLYIHTSDSYSSAPVLYCQKLNEQRNQQLGGHICSIDVYTCHSYIHECIYVYIYLYTRIFIFIINKREYVCLCIWVCVCIHIIDSCLFFLPFICASASIYLWICVYAHGHIQIHTYAHSHKYVLKCIHVCMRTCLHAHAHTSHTYTYTHTLTHMPAQARTHTHWQKKRIFWDSRRNVVSSRYTC